MMRIHLSPMTKVKKSVIISLTLIVLTGVCYAFLNYNATCYKKENDAIASDRRIELCRNDLDYEQKVDLYGRRVDVYFRILVICILCTLVSFSAFTTAYATRYGANSAYKRRITILALINILLLIVFRVLYELSYVYSPHNENHLWNSIYYVSFWGCAITFLISFIASVAAVIYRVEYRSK